MARLPHVYYTVERRLMRLSVFLHMLGLSWIVMFKTLDQRCRTAVFVCIPNTFSVEIIMLHVSCYELDALYLNINDGIPSILVVYF